MTAKIRSPKILKKKNKELEQELKRKEKALAETAALLALKKDGRSYEEAKDD